MAVQSTVDSARLIGERFADLIRGEPGLVGLWAHPGPRSLDLYLITQPLDAEAERRIYSAWVDVFAASPEADIHLHLLNPKFFAEDKDFMGDIPSAATRIPLPA